MSKEFIKITWAAVDRKIKATLAETDKFMGALRNDFKFSQAVLRKDPRNQILRRIAVRSFCALVEAATHEMKWFSLNFHSYLHAKLSEADIACLREESYELDDKGRSVTKSLRLKTMSNFIFACKTNGLVFCAAHDVDFKADGWRCVKETFKIRDRLMHPKLARGIDLTDDEAVLLEKAAKWFFDEMHKLSKSWDVNKAFDRRSSGKLSELN